MRQFVSGATGRHPFALEDAVWQLLHDSIELNNVVIVDDFHLLFAHATGCHQYPRSSYYEVMMQAVLQTAQSRRCQLVLGSNGNLPRAFEDVAWTTSIGDFSVDDYRHLFGQVLPRPLDQIDFDAVYRFAPNLTCHRIRHIGHWWSSRSHLTTGELLDFIQSQGMSSNVQVSEVQDVELSDLVGVDDVVAALEDQIILPMENLKLSQELGLTPKRGVMLAGPPGTGKTTIGRALARRLRGKFFLIDGTCISGTDHFYYRIESIFRQAVANAPSIVFIDDSDVIFESGREHGLYRYLLTKLDGLESRSASDVCVMMTAMDLGNIPPALVRSGRIELWLEMQLPDKTARRKLLEKLFAAYVHLDAESAWSDVISATDRFTGADLKRMVQDAKLLMAVDISRRRVVRNFRDYLLQSATAIADSRLAYARAAEKAVSVNADRPRWFNIHPELFELSTGTGHAV